MSRLDRVRRRVFEEHRVAHPRLVLLPNPPRWPLLTYTSSNPLRPYCVTFVGQNSVSIMLCSSGSTIRALPFSIKNFSTPSSTPANTTTNIGSTSTGPTSSSSPTGTKSNDSNAGAIAGGVVGGLAVLVLGAIGCFFIMRRRANTAAATEKAGLQQQAPMHYNNYASQHHQLPSEPVQQQPVQPVLSYEQRGY